MTEMTGAVETREMRRQLAVRTHIGDYRLCGPLGVGAAGRSFVAERPGAAGRVQIVAVKFRLSADDDGARRSAWRARLQPTLELQHPHVVNTIELGEVDGNSFLVMEYVCGEDLGAVFAQLGRAGLPVEIALVATQQCLAGLHKAQSVRAPQAAGGLVHGAIRPSNMIVTYDGPTRLTDFGAPAASEAPGLAYAAPEQLRGEPADHQSDLFSVAVVLWEALAGRRLFAGGEIGNAPEAIREAILERPLPSLRGLRPEIPEDLEALLGRALERDRQRRFGTALELARAIEVVARRYTRPTAEGVGLWLRGLFGGERAKLRRSVADGVNVAEALARLAEINGAPPVASGQAPSRPGRSRPLWVNSRTPVESMAVVNTPAPNLMLPAGPAPGSALRPSAGELAAVDVGKTEERPAPVLELVSPARREAPRPGRRAALSWLISAGTLVAVLAVAGWSLLGQRPSAPPGLPDSQAALTGAVRLESQPPGAHVVVDGDPSGRQTPAVLDGLRAGRSLDVQLQLPGYQTVTRRIQVTPGPARVHRFTLVEDWGSLAIDGLPAGARVFVDDQQAEAEDGGRLSLAIGKRHLRIETRDDVLYAGDIEVHRGEQRLTVPSKGRQR
jgi:serine/threonine-protein kinase